MGNLSAPVITRAGRRVLAQAQTGLPLHFTRVAVGDGELPDGANIDDIEALSHYVMDLPINSNTIIGDGTTKLEAVLRNIYLAELFEFREIAIFANDNDSGADILYAYSNSGDSPAAYIPAGNGPNAINLRIGLITVIKQAANVIVDVTDGWGYVTHEEWDEFALNLYGPYVKPPAALWTADDSSPNTLRRMPFGDIVELMFAHTAPDGESVLLGYNPVMKSLFGYPMDLIVTKSGSLFGGDPTMQVEDYIHGELFGGDPTMAVDDYPDGNLSGGDPYAQG
ncbi:MAG: phage tail protein [Synergistaceae bacterium]|jgi:hypothetical protein|nr:phage tail protein [Synergistaceae bacterium]